MGRGTEKVNQQIDYTNELNRRLLAEREAARAGLLPKFEALYTRPGYGEAEKAAITAESLGALGSAFDALRQRAENRLARTRNTAGYGETLDELAREQARQTAGVARQNLIGFSDEAIRQREAALRGIAGLYGVDTQLLGRTLGLPAELFAARPKGGGFRLGLPGFSIGFG